MEIHLIRHTEVSNKENRCYGFSDLPLRENYIDDLRKIRLEKKYEAVFCSPATRCQILATYHQLDYQIDNRLSEMNFGDWEMKSWDEIPQNEIDPWYEDFINVRTTNGESLMDMRVRVLSLFDEITTDFHNGKLLIITHAGVIRIILQYILEFPLKNIFNVHIEFGKTTIIKIDKNIMTLKCLNF